MICVQGAEIVSKCMNINCGYSLRLLSVQWGFEAKKYLMKRLRKA